MTYFYIFVYMSKINLLSNHTPNMRHEFMKGAWLGPVLFQDKDFIQLYVKLREHFLPFLEKTFRDHFIFLTVYISKQANM